VVALRRDLDSKQSGAVMMEVTQFKMPHAAKFEKLASAYSRPVSVLRPRSVSLLSRVRVYRLQ
jgi:hypothetical protein